MVRRTRIIVLTSVLLLFAGQLASLVHAADHPFHEPEDICASFISLEQHDSSVAITVAVDDFTCCVDEFNSGHELLVYAQNRKSNPARAPPLNA